MIAAPRPLKPVAIPPVGGEAAALPPVAAAGDAVDHRRPEDPAEDLGDPRVDGVAAAITLRVSQHPERDRRVDVAAADRPDHVGHDQAGRSRTPARRRGCRSRRPARIAEPGPSMTSTRCRRTRRRRSGARLVTIAARVGDAGADGRVPGSASAVRRSGGGRARHGWLHAADCTAGSAEPPGQIRPLACSPCAQADRAADRHPGDPRRRHAAAPTS